MFIYPRNYGLLWNHIKEQRLRNSNALKSKFSKIIFECFRLRKKEKKMKKMKMIDKKNKIRPPPRNRKTETKLGTLFKKKSFLNSSAGKETLKKSAEHNLEKKKKGSNSLLFGLNNKVFVLK